MRPARLDHSFFGDEPRSHLGALLLRKGLVTHEELDQALTEREPDELLGEALCRLRICFENDIARVLAEQANVDFVDIAISGVDPRAVRMLRKREAKKMHAIPVRLHPDETVSVAVADPTDDAFLVTCAYLVDRTSPWVLQSLFLGAIGDAKDRGAAALEAFAYRYPEGQTDYERFLVHRTVFQRDFLSDFGFRTVRASGQVELARLELGGLVPVLEGRRAKVLRALRDAFLPEPVPAPRRP